MRLSVTKKLTFAVLLSIIIFFFVITIFIYKNLDLDYRKNVVLKAPHGVVSIKLDQYDIPHIRAETNDLDAFFALGYMHAKHRFWQMELQRHIVKGTLSELFGKNTIEQDKFFRTWGFYRSALSDWEYLDVKTRDAITSYTAGVNAYLENGKLPLELILLRYTPKKWENADSYSWEKMLSFQLQMGWQDKVNNYILQKKFGNSAVLDLETNYPNSAPTILSEADLRQNKITNHFNLNDKYSNSNKFKVNGLKRLLDASEKVKHSVNIKDVPGKGSNNWVISGKLTSTGKPLLANDTHLEFSSPNILYQVELEGPHLHTIGASIPGIFAPIIGHNNQIAWGITDAVLDAQDVYLLPKNVRLNSIKETISVRNDKAVILNLKHSNIGPIINSILKVQPQLSEYVVIKWPILNPGDTTPRSLLLLNYAQDWTEFTHALEYYVGPSQNFVYADIQNNIGYYLPGRIPIRHPDNLRYPVPVDDLHKWQGFIPFNELPHVYNPPEGFIVTANNKIVPDSYPYKLSLLWRAPPYRAERIKAMLQGKKQLTIGNMEEIQMDVKSNLWLEYKPLLSSTQPLDDQSRIALIKLHSWNGIMSPDSVSATIFAAWFNELKEIIPKSYLGKYHQRINPLFITKQLTADGKYCKIANVKNCNELLSMSLQAAMKKLTLKLGDDISKWQWAKLHHAQFNNLIFGSNKWLGWLWNRTIVSGGDGFTVNAGTYDDDFKQIAGATYRQIIDLNDFGNSEFIYPLGQSGNPFSKHYDDMLSMWQQGRYIRENSYRI